MTLTTLEHPSNTPLTHMSHHFSYTPRTHLSNTNDNTIIMTDYCCCRCWWDSSLSYDGDMIEAYPTGNKQQQQLVFDWSKFDLIITT